MEITLARGTLVGFAEVLEPGEEALVMVVLEDNGNRALVETLLGWPINPTHTYAKSDLKPIATQPALDAERAGRDADAADLADTISDLRAF
jgi:hypothetical protein